MLFISGNIQAYEFPIEIIEYIDNTRVVAFINENDIDKALAWHPVEGSPPLTVAEALKAVHEQIVSDPELENATLTGIELKQIPRHENHWHYLVKIKIQVDEVFKSHYFIVLMNGKIIPGLKEPETYK